MGNWNRRRWIPRKKYKQEDLPPSQPYQYNQSPYHAIQENSAPLWEIDFCRVAGIPWHKVVSAKTYMDCYENVVKWDDSAGQEAFNVAKRRYWAKISGFPPQNPPPNPDLYIDKVDWDSAIDPELILDLDREYFNPNEVKNSVKSENNLDPGCTLVWEDKTADNGENPWGSGNVQGSKTAANGENPWESGNVQDSNPVGNRDNPWESASIEDTKQTWNEWYTPVNIKNDNPWERSSPKTQGILKGTAWGGCGNESWGWNSGMNYQNGYACVDNSFSNLWYQSGACVSGAKGNEWVDNSVGSWGQTYWNTGGHEQRNSDYGSRWNRNFSRGGGTTTKDRRWRGSEGTSWDYQQQPRQSNDRNVDFGRPSRGNNTFYSGSRKRESSSQHVPRYKSSRFQSDEQRTANNWREENKQKRVTFNSMYD